MSEKNENLYPENDSEQAKSEHRKIRMRDIVAYVLCIILSFVIWVYVVKLDNENEEYTFTQISVQLDGVKEMKDKYNLSIISGYNNETSITVRGSKKDILKYKAEDIIAHVDLSEVKLPDRHYLEISVDLPNGLTLVSAEPSRINVLVDETITKEVDLEVNLLYNVATDITIHEPTPSVSKVSVTGPMTLLNNISRAVAIYDIGNVTTSVNVIAPIKLYDLDNSEISNPYIKMDISEVRIKVPVTTEKMVPFAPEFVVDDGNEFDYKVQFISDMVKIVGDPKILTDVTEAKINLGNITNATKGEVSVNKITNFPNGVKIADQNIDSFKYDVLKSRRDINK